MKHYPYTIFSLSGSETVVSYLKKSKDLINSAKYIDIFDVLVDMLAALYIIPAVLIYKLDPASDHCLCFITSKND